MKLPKMVLAALLLTGLPAALSAQADAPLPQSAIDAGVAPGAIVYDLQGNVVGYIARITGSNVVVDTGTTQSTLPANGFGHGSNGPVIGMTRGQLDTAAGIVHQEIETRLAAALVPGASVFSSDRVFVGTVRQVEASGNVLIDRTGGAIYLPHGQFTAGPDGAPTLRYTAAALQAALAQQAPALLAPPPVPAPTAG